MTAERGETNEQSRTSHQEGLTDKPTAGQPWTPAKPLGLPGLCPCHPPTGTGTGPSGSPLASVASPEHRAKGSSQLTTPGELLGSKGLTGCQLDNIYVASYSWRGLQGEAQSWTCYLQRLQSLKPKHDLPTGED